MTHVLVIVNENTNYRKSRTLSGLSTASIVSTLDSRSSNLSLINRKPRYSVSVYPKMNFLCMLLIPLLRVSIRLYLGPLGGTQLFFSCD